MVLAVVLFLGMQGQTEKPSLAALAASSVPLDTALSNGKPTLMEFYADWCTSCQAMTTDLQTLKGRYGLAVNFVMLNVDNPKWLPEIMRFGVDGIPHFVFLNDQGAVLANAVGQQPQSVLAADLDALTTKQSLPVLAMNGQVSEIQPEVTAKRETDPRSHGGLPAS
jgi:thioredoxin-like negative regulator of GroEL